MAKRILVPLDRRERAETVLPLVADMARAGGATVRLLHVAPLPRIRQDACGRVIVRFGDAGEEILLEADAPVMVLSLGRG